MDENHPHPRTSETVPLPLVQHWFQAVISDPGGVTAGLQSASARSRLLVAPHELETWVCPSRSLSSLERLAIYSNAYFARLLECLRAEFPLLAVAAGREAFDALAIGFLVAHPSRSYTLNRLGASLPNYLAETRPARDGAADDVSEAPDWADLLVDLAQLEWAINEVFDGPGSERRPRNLHDERQLLGSGSGLVRVVTCPSLRLLTFRFPLHDYFSQLKLASSQGDVAPTDDHPQEIVPPVAGRSHLALVRRDYVVWRYPLSAAQFALLTELQSGRPLAEAIETALESLPAGADEAPLEARLERWFHDWTEAGFLVEVSLPAG